MRLVAVALGAVRVAVVAFGATFAEQPGVMVVRVVDSITRRPLANADIVDLRTDAVRLTNERGEARVAIEGALRVRVRQIGYRTAEQMIAQSATAGDTVTVALRRVAFRLPSVLTTAEATCRVPAVSDAAPDDSAPGALTAATLLQIRTAAERYESFRRMYPFRVRVERRSTEVGRDGTAPRIVVSHGTAESDRYAEPYDPGALVRSERRGFSVPVLFVTALADRTFLARHCFAVRGVESLGADRVLRVEFSPSRGVRDAEWAGAVLVDSATSLLRRVEFRVANLQPLDMPARLEGYITFSSPSPYVVLPESTLAGWWRTAPDDREGHVWGPPDAVQLLHIESVEYRKTRPPAP